MTVNGDLVANSTIRARNIVAYQNINPLYNLSCALGTSAKYFGVSYIGGLVMGGGNITSVGTFSFAGGVGTRTLNAVRSTVAGAAGADILMQAGGATSGATDKDGGMVILAPGISTGTGKASVRIQKLTRASSTGTSSCSGSCSATS